MQENLEQYVNRIFKETKDFFRENFPKEYEDIKTGIKVACEPNTKYKGAYRVDYSFARDEITLTTHESSEKKPKDDDTVWNFLQVKMKRKNAYMVSLTHEIQEAIYYSAMRAKNQILSEYDVILSHELATEQELKALKKLISQSKGQDKEEFKKRKEAREKEIKRREAFIKTRGN
ncbi:MAG: hypothetical protein Q8N77_03840 [Nanoarchaeota archaeon]|nr:hypothetical protein [Nanoarchaeota archaeon]